MKYLKKYKYLFIILFLSLGLVFTEFYIFKGYFSSQFLLSSYSNKLNSISPNDPDSLLFYDYSVKYQDDTILVFNLRHNGLGCQYIEHYRDNELFPNLQETVEYSPYLYRIKSPYKNMEIPMQFDCGTGIGLSTICPFEKYSYTFNLKDFIGQRYDLDKLMNRDNRTYYDIINEEAICSFNWIKDSTTYQWNTDYECNPKDSIEFQFHLPVYSVYDKKERKIYSNPIKVSYCTIIDALEEDMKSFNFDNGRYQFEYLSFQNKI